MSITLRKTKSAGFFCFILVIFMMSAGCRKNGIPRGLLNGFEQTNLVADTAGFKAVMIDNNLVNAWGMAFLPSGPIWISDNGSGLSTIYNKDGGTLRPPVTIPAPGATSGGTPTGVLFNSTTDFLVSSGKQTLPAKFIFATEDGTIAAWASGNTAIIVADRSGFNAVYKGIAMAEDAGNNFLYATNFRDAKIDVFDKDF